MFQKTSKTLFYMKIMVCKIPPWGGAKPFLANGLIQYIQNYEKISTKQVIKLFELLLQSELTHTYLKYI